MTQKPAPLSQASIPLLRGIHTLLTDIDDTLTSAGQLTARAYLALEELSAAGLRVIPVTGRPVGWCDMIARFWPVAGVIGENGAFTFRYDHTRKKMQRHYARGSAQRHADREKLNALAAQIVAAVPGAAISADQAYREADLAIDFCEDVPPLAQDDIARIVALFEAAGAQTKVSSIHVNGWFGSYDKLTTARQFLGDVFGVNALEPGVAFIGDSPNDAPLFEALALSFGVANVLDFEGRIPHMPHYVATERGGAGFAQIAAAILSAKSVP